MYCRCHIVYKNVVTTSWCLGRSKSHIQPDTRCLKMFGPNIFFFAHAGIFQVNIDFLSFFLYLFNEWSLQAWPFCAKSITVSFHPLGATSGQEVPSDFFLKERKKRMEFSVKSEITKKMSAKKKKMSNQFVKSTKDKFQVKFLQWTTL